ncbi:MAG: hypothetical protein U5K55_08755 [Aliarcobacter sp.]|nr:hypothetical protein [Aliarcobacter sp.]
MLNTKIRKDESNQFMEMKVQQDIQIIYFEKKQADYLHHLSDEIAFLGGPEDPRTNSLVSMGVVKLKEKLSSSQNSILHNYINGETSVLVFENMNEFSIESDTPDKFPPLSVLEKSYDILYLGGRNQILLKLIEEDAFAYDIDNEGKLIRVVANLIDENAPILIKKAYKSYFVKKSIVLNHLNMHYGEVTKIHTLFC